MDDWAATDADFARMIGWSDVSLPFGDTFSRIWYLCRIHGVLYAGGKSPGAFRPSCPSKFSNGTDRTAVVQVRVEPLDPSRPTWVGGWLDTVFPAWQHGQTVVATRHRFDGEWAFESLDDQPVLLRPWRQTDHRSIVSQYLMRAAAHSPRCCSTPSATAWPRTPAASRPSSAWCRAP